MPLYRVAPIPKNVPIEGGRTVSAGALEITASAPLDDNQAFARFEANLPLAGILAVDVKLSNRSDEPTKTLQFELRDANGKRFSQMDAKKTLKQLMKYEGVRLYAKIGREETQAQLQAVTLPKKLKLAAREETQGVLFFDAKQDVAALQGLVLSVQGTSPPLRIPLN